MCNQNRRLAKAAAEEYCRTPAFDILENGRCTVQTERFPLFIYYNIRHEYLTDTIQLLTVLLDYIV